MLRDVIKDLNKKVFAVNVEKNLQQNTVMMKLFYFIYLFSFHVYKIKVNLSMDVL